MSETGKRLKWCCWLFVCTILLSSAQLTIVGLHTEDGSWFEYFSDAMGEEETEDSEEKEEANKREFDAWHQLGVAVFETNSNDFLHKDIRYHSVFREVFSPPPELCV